MLDAGLPQRLTRTQRLALLGAVLVVVVALLGLASARAWFAGTPTQTRAPQDLPGGVTLPDVQLLNGSGTATSLEGLYGGPYLLYFGFTSCPDFCPLALGTFADVKERLGAQAEPAHFVFVSVDGERDTPAIVAAYVARFDADFVGLTGQPSDVRRLGEPLGLWFERQPSAGALSYTVDHTTAIYLIGADGTPLRSYPFDTPSEVLAADLQALVNEMSVRSEQLARYQHHSKAQEQRQLGAQHHKQ